MKIISTNNQPGFRPATITTNTERCAPNTSKDKIKALSFQDQIFAIDRNKTKVNLNINKKIF